MNYSLLKIDQDSSILFALKKMDSIQRKLLLVFKEDIFKGLLSIGDIQRAIIQGVSLDVAIKNILRKNVRIATDGCSDQEIKTMMLEYRMECLPVLNEKGSLSKVVMWEDVFSEKDPLSVAKFHLPIVIMAGGQGVRLRPLTNIIPKPLIPIGKKTLMEDIMDKFVKYGCSDFYVSVNYKANVIKRYFDNLNNSEYNISYFQEDSPLGTAGSLTLLKGKINSTFWVSNCDILVNDSYDQILEYHRNNRNDLTIVAAIRSFPINYGVLETREEGLLDKIVEKPNVTYKINTGLYILEPELLDEIPENSFYHITHLIDKMREQNRRIGVFPITEGSWIDVTGLVFPHHSLDGDTSEPGRRGCLFHQPKRLDGYGKLERILEISKKIKANDTNIGNR